MYVDTPVKRYSSGMRVRLAFAVAAFLEPDILVIDEVLAVGDAEFQKKAIGKMQDISQGDGRTVLFVSHNMAAVKSLCTRAIVLEHGTSVFEGETDEAVDFYLNNEKSRINSKLLDITNRSGNGKVVFSEFHLENKNGVSVTQVLNGGFVNFCFKLKVKHLHSTSTKVDVGFSIHSLNEQLLFVLYSSYQNQLFEIKEEGDCYIKCGIDNLALNAGEYYVKGRVLCDNEESDWLKEPLGKLMVVKGDYYKTGSLGFEGKSLLLIKGKWLSKK
jgi:lipopolysaccharide transport system ATP-binding protein